MILSQIRIHDKAKESKLSFLQTFSAYEESTVRQALGNFGVRLLGFAAEVDFAHPDLSELFDEEFSQSIMCLVKLAHDNDLNEFVADNLRRVITKHPRYKELSRVIDAPSKNLRHCRFSKPEFWSRIRDQKRTQNVDLRVMLTKGEDFWEETPDDFVSYLRHFNRLLPLIEEATAQHEHFTNFGLTSLAQEIQSQLTRIMAESKDDRYYGFNRITMTAAAVILGKMHDATFQISKNDSMSLRLSRTSYRCRLTCQQFYGNRHFDALNQEFSLPFMEYKPLIIPVCQMERRPGEMVRLLQELDSWPELGHKAVFDNYWVMLPDFNITGDQELMYDLVEDQKLVGVLLGEKDGDVFFVSYWM